MRILSTIDKAMRRLSKCVQAIQEWLLLREYGILAGHRQPPSWRVREGISSHNQWPKRKDGSSVLIVGAVKGLQSESFPEIKGTGSDDEQ
jgi:hypothetical protein